MNKTKTILEVLISCFGEEFPEIATMRGPSFYKHFNIWPTKPAHVVRLCQTYKIAQYVDDDHRNIVEAIVIEIEMINKPKG